MGEGVILPGGFCGVSAEVSSSGIRESNSSGEAGVSSAQVKLRVSVAPNIMDFINVFTQTFPFVNGPLDKRLIFN
jgi:hypothetical protein